VIPAPNISADADSLVDNPSSGRVDHSTDPLQRRAELIDRYDRHGYPTRARYLERQPDGQALLHRGSELNSLDSEHRREIALAWARDMLAYWTGWSADSWDQLAPVFSALADFTAHARRVEADQRASLDARERSRARVQVAREACRPIADTIMALGLWARVNSYLEPIGVATVDSLCYQQLKALRRFCGSYTPLRIASPGPDTEAPFVIVCERCSVVDATLQAANRCRLCAKSRPRKEGAFRVPVTHPELPWLVTGDRAVYVRICEQCGETFVAQRPSARTCSAACRVARARSRQV
jgi:hypothetical protein